MIKGGSRSANIGERTEKIALKALRQLELEGKISFFARTNESGYDYTIQKKDGHWTLIEVKSSTRGAKRHKKRYPTPCLVIRNHRSNIPSDLEAQLVAKAKRDIIKLLQE